MTGPHATNILIQAAQATFASLSGTYRDVRFPSISGHGDPLLIPAVWTLDGTRPRWNNLAVIVGALEPAANRGLDLWHTVSAAFAPRLTALADGDQYTLIFQEDQQRLVQHAVPLADLRQTLAEKRQSLFAPSRLAAVRGDQLTFADLDTFLPKDTLQFRYQAKLDEAVEKALMSALYAQREATAGPENRDAAVIEVAIAYLSARILADKGFFAQYPSSVNDPASLLQLTVEHRNGFFSHVINTQLQTLQAAALQQLAAHLGSSVTFALIDDRDVGHLYERSVIVLHDHTKGRPPRSLDIEIPNLQQHYTPMAIAERMLSALPLERLRPEERIVFDPAAGSGTLLLAATKRLATMPDIQRLDVDRRSAYLAGHVLGNDIDPNAQLITRVRYALVQETLSETFPAPAQFTGERYENDEAWPTPRPRVIVANPPFAEEAGKQSAVTFIKQVLKHLQTNDQFAFILPQSFLTATTHGWAEVRDLVADTCYVLETWQLPEGAIGLKAEQATCVISGIVEAPNAHFTIGRAIVSGSRKDLVFEKGFLGQAWIGSVSAGQWRTVTAPVPLLTDTIPLGALFSVHIGVTLQPGVPPVSAPMEGVPTKRLWKHGWRGRHRPHVFWADPRRAPPAESYIRYGKAHLKRHQPHDEPVYDSPKILVTRSTNRSARNPISAYYDSLGLCPTSDMYCIVPRVDTERRHQTAEFATIWTSLTDTERLFWLLGILHSEITINVSMSNRDVRHFDKDNWLHLPLPTVIDRDIMLLVGKIIQREQHGATDEELIPLHERLNKVVEASYGHPVRPLTLVRTGELPEVQEWQKELSDPPLSVTGQVLEIAPEQNQIRLYLEGLFEEDTEAWVPLPPELPGWALDGTVFLADLSETVETFAHLRERPWALRNVRHTPTPYLSFRELSDQLFTPVEDTA